MSNLDTPRPVKLTHEMNHHNYQLPQDTSITHKVPVPVGGASCGSFSPADSPLGQHAGLCWSMLRCTAIFPALLCTAAVGLWELHFSGCLIYWLSLGQRGMASALSDFCHGSAPTTRPTPPPLTQGSQVGPGTPAPACAIGAVTLICHKRQREVTFSRLRATKWWH